MEEAILIDNRYRVLSKLGVGGMGEVFLAADTLKGDQQIAIKTIKSTMLDNSGVDAIAGFRHEFEVMTRLKHPNLARVYDFGKDYGRNEYYITMEYLEGITLRTYLKNRVQIPAIEVIEIFVPLLRAVEFIHTRNIIYRDIKPENIVINFDEKNRLKSVKLLDFGLSDYKKKNHSHQTIKGTVNYMAPEVLSGNPQKNSDIFSLGVMFFELLTGSFIYKTESTNRGSDNDSVRSSVIYTLRSEESFKDSIEINQIADNRLVQLIQNMTAYQMKDRYQNCAQIIAEINTLFNCDYPIEVEETKEAYILGSGFVDRKNRLSFLKKGLKDNGHQLYLVKAKSGWGKSRLYSEFKKYCRLLDFTFFTTDCSRPTPFSPLVKILERLITNTSPEIINKYGSHLKKIVPNALQLASFIPIKELEGEHEVKLLTGLLADFFLDCANFNITQRKSTFTIIFVDNIQWADQATLGVLKEILYKQSEAIEQSSLRLFAAFTIEEEVVDNKFLSDLVALGRLNSYQLAPFDDNILTEYISMIFGDNIQNSLVEGIRNISQKTGGNILFLQETIKSLLENNSILKNSNGAWQLTRKISKEDLPDEVETIIKAKIEKLNYSDKQLEFIVSLSLLNIGNFTTQELISFYPWLTSDEVLSFIEDLISREILVLYDERWQFTSGLFADVLKKRVEKPIRKVLHLRLAQNIYALYQNIEVKDLPSPVLDELAYQYMNSGTTDSDILQNKVVFFIQHNISRLLRKSENKKASYIMSQLMKIYEKHKDILRDKTLAIYDQHLLIQYQLGNWNEYEESSLSVLAKFKGDANWQLYTRIQNRLATLYNRKWKGKEALKLYLNVLTTYKRNKSIEDIFLTRVRIAGCQSLLSNYNLAMKIFQSLLKNVEEFSVNAQSELYFALGRLYGLTDQKEMAIEYYEKTIKIDRELSRLDSLAVTYNNIGLEYYYLNQYDIAIKYLEKSFYQAQQLYNKYLMCLSTTNIANCYIVEGKYQRAITYLLKVNKLDTELGIYSSIAISAGNLGYCYVKMDDEINGFKHYELCVDTCRQHNITYYLGDYLIFWGQFLFDYRRYTEALPLIEEAKKLVTEQNKSNFIRWSTVLLYQLQYKFSNDINTKTELVEKIVEFGQQYSGNNDLAENNYALWAILRDDNVEKASEFAKIAKERYKDELKNYYYAELVEKIDNIEKWEATITPPN